MLTRRKNRCENMKLKLGNPRILALILTNAFLLSGCNQKLNNYDLSNDKVATVTDIDKNINDNPQTNPVVISSPEPKKVIKVVEKCNNVVATNKTVTVRKKTKKESKALVTIGNFQKLKEIGKTNNNWSLVKYRTNQKVIKGYIKTKNIQQLGKNYIEVDISDQKMTYYKKGKKFLETPVVTGKDSTPTVQGIFDIYSKARNYTMIGENHSYEYFSHYVLKFYEAYYIHDARRSQFGGEIYHYNGSHGCVNTPYTQVKKLYENTKLHTKVLVHK